MMGPFLQISYSGELIIYNR